MTYAKKILLVQIKRGLHGRQAHEKADKAVWW
jgi:hypothetical protein